MAIVTTKLQFSSDGDVSDTLGLIGQGVLSIAKPYNNGSQYLSFETNKVKALYGDNIAPIRWYVTADSTHEINTVRYKAKILSMATNTTQGNALCCVGATNPALSYSRSLMSVEMFANNKTLVVSNMGYITTPTITGVNENNFFNNEFSIEFRRTADGTQLTITDINSTVNFSTSWILETGVDKQLNAFWFLWAYGWLNFEIYDIEVDVEQYYPSPTINNISRDKNELTINASSSEQLSDRALSYKWCEGSYNGTVVSLARRYTVTSDKGLYITVTDSNNKTARTTGYVYFYRNHKYNFGSNRYKYWLQTSINGSDSVYEDVIGNVNEYEPLPSNNIVDIWCYSMYRLHIYDVKKDKYYCIQYNTRVTAYGMNFYINSDLDNSICTYYRSMDSLSRQFLMYSSSHTYVTDTNIDPNVTDTVNCYFYQNYYGLQTINEVNSYFKGLKAFQIPASPTSQTFYINQITDTKYVETNHPKTLEIRWRFTSTNDSAKMVIIYSNTFDFNTFYLVKDAVNNRYYIQNNQYRTPYNSSLLPRNFDPTKWHTLCIQGYGENSRLCMIYIDGSLVLEQQTTQSIFYNRVICFGGYSSLAHEPIYDEVVMYDGIKYNTETYRVNNDYPLIDPYYEPPQPTVNFYSTKEKVSAGEYFDLILSSNDISFTDYSLYLNGAFVLSGGGEIKLFERYADTRQKDMNYGCFWDGVNFSYCCITEDEPWAGSISASNIEKESELVFNILGTRYSGVELGFTEYYESLIDPSRYSLLEEGDDKVIYITMKARLLDVRAGLIYHYASSDFTYAEYYVWIDSVSDNTAVVKIHRIQENAQSRPVIKEYNVPFIDGLELKTVMKLYDFSRYYVPKAQISTYANGSLIDTSITDISSIQTSDYVTVSFFERRVDDPSVTLPTYSGRVSVKDTYACVTKDEEGTLYRTSFSSATIRQQLFRSGQNTYRVVFKDTDGEQRERTCNVLVEAQDFSDLFVRYVPNFNTKKVLEYKTQIFTSYNHNEERIPLRQCPRVSFEYEYDLYNHESFVGFNNSFNESGLNAMYSVPSWIDAIQVSDTSENITLPTENNFSNGADVLVFKSFSEYEVVSCTITNNTMVLNGLEDIHTDCIVVPIFNCYLVDAPKLKQQDYNHSVSVKFITAQNVYNGFKNYNTTYLGHDLLADFYVTSRELTTDIDQDIITTDYDIGLRSLYTLNDRTYNGISFNVQCLMSEYPVLQNFIKRRFGKVNPFFIPKETGDLIKKGNGIISTNLNIEMNNFDFDKRPYLFIRLKNGNYLCRKVVSTSADKGTLVLDSALNVKYEDITSINTLLFVRLDSDKITYKSVGYGMYSVDLSCVEIKFEEYSTITDYDIRP